MHEAGTPKSRLNTHGDHRVAVNEEDPADFEVTSGPPVKHPTIPTDKEVRKELNGTFGEEHITDVLLSYPAHKELKKRRPLWPA